MGDRLACVDGLRAIAALSVVGVHTSFVSGFTSRSPLGIYTARLEIGVSVFFVISGFLLYRPWVQAAAGMRPAPSVGRYCTRRLLRVLPAYWLAFTVVTYVLHADRVVPGWRAALLYYGFAQIYSPTHALTGITQAWSLCTEMSFYVALPALAVLLAGRSRHRPTNARSPWVRRQVVGLGALVASSLGFRLWALAGTSRLRGLMPDWLPANLDLFALGMLLAVATTWVGQHPGQATWLDRPWVPWASWALAAGAFVAVSHLGISTIPLYRTSLPLGLTRQVLYGLFGVFLVAPTVVGPARRGLIRRGLQLRPVAAVGAVSYGIYLWHQAWVTLWLRWTGDRLFTIPLPALAVPVLALAVASAAASYLLFERPLLRLKPRRVPAPPLPRLDAQAGSAHSAGPSVSAVSTVSR